MRRLVGLVLAVLMLVGCNTSEHTMQLIKHAERVMLEHPDSALNIIRSVDTETIHGEEDMAHYRLVMAEVCYYNRIMPNRRSVAEPLFDYYLSSDDHAKRARALYQHALVMQSEGENAKAMYSLLEAEASLKHLDNPRLKALVHRTKGNIYHLECLFKHALEEYEHAKEAFDNAGLDEHSLYVLRDIAIEYKQLRDYHKSNAIFWEVEELARTRQDLHLQHVSLIFLCWNYIEIEDMESCLSTYPLINISLCNGTLACDYYCISAILETYKGNYDGADNLLSIAHELPVESSMRLSYTEYMVNLLRGNSDKALETYKSMIAVQDKNVFNLINSSLLQTQVDLLSNKIESAKELQTKNKILYLLLTAIVTIVLSVLIFIIVYRHRRLKQEVKRYIATIADFELLSKSTSQELDTVIEKLYRQSLNEINELCEIYYEQGGSSRLASKIVAQVEKNIDRLKTDKQRIAELESAVNISRNGIMQKLREQCPELSERDMRIALYTYADFSNRAISLLVGCGSEAVAKFKYSIREQIKSSNAEDWMMLIEPLYNKKHS